MKYNYSLVFMVLAIQLMKYTKTAHTVLMLSKNE